MRLAVAAACAAALLTQAGDAHAHARSVSYATWTVTDHTATVELRMSMLDRSAVFASDSSLSDPRRLAAHLQRRVVLIDERGVCTADNTSFTELSQDRGWLRFEWSVRCATGAGLRVRSDLLFGVMPGHVQFARVVGDAVSPELLLDDATREVSLARQIARSRLATARRYVSLGVHHLLSGWDHIVFVLALLLAATSWRQVVTAVSGFTIGHSVTLVLAATGTVNPNQVAVEALIGLSIVLVAVESAWIAGGDPTRRRLPFAAVAALVACAAVCAVVGAVPAVSVVGIALFATCYFALIARARGTAALRWGIAALFGLIHGFGFAGVLSELSSEGVSAVRLVSFNVGVEIGQLLVIAAAWPLLVLARKRSYHLTVVHYGSAAAVALGAFWFASRAWFSG